MRSSYIVLSNGEKKRDLLSSLHSELLHNKHTWLVQGNVEELEDLYFPVDSQVYVFTMEDLRIKIREVYKIGPKLPQLSLEFGSWTSDLLTTTKVPFFERRKNMYGYQFKSKMGNEMPFQGVKKEKDGVILELKGILGEVWHQGIEKTMNFTTQITHSADGYWGSKNENGEWNGMINEIHQNQTDMAVTAFFVTYDRSEVVDFSPPFSKNNKSKLFKSFYRFF